jgi:hypothetical protein
VDPIVILHGSDLPVGKLKDLLLRYLQAVSYPPWPGTDGLMVDDVVAMYPIASEQGLVPGPNELRHRHPELAKELQEFFAAKLVTERSE